MKTTILSCATVLFAAVQTNATILTGPVSNPANNHEYFLIAPESWTLAEAEAERLGGTLAVVKTAAEQEWICSKVGWYDGTRRGFWIGLHRDWNGAPLHWVTDTPWDYSNWFDGEPSNSNGNENAVHVRGGDDKPSTWNDLAENNSMCAVVEVPGKSSPRSVSEKEKALVGEWYNNGDPNQVCQITATDKMIFAIDQNTDASRMIYTPEGFLFSPKWKQHVDISDGKLLWSKGNWWSRKPVAFKAVDALPKAEADKTETGRLHIIPD
jgi:hypothetical protein